MKYTKELKVGISVLLAAAILYLGIRFLKGSDVFSSSHHYYLKYPTTEALEVSHPVLIHGIVVGQVNRLQLMPESYFVEVRISVNGDINIPKGTIGELQSSSLLGGKSIALILSEERNNMHENEDTLKSRIKQGFGDLFSQPNTQKGIEKTIENLNLFVESLSTSGQLTIETLRRIDTIAFSVSRLLNTNQPHIEHSMQQFSQMSERLNRATLQMDSLMLDLRLGVQDLDLKSMGEVARGVNQSVSEAHLLLKSLRTGKGTLGKLVTDEKLYLQLNQTLKQLGDVLQHLEERPRDFLAPLGRRNPKTQKKKN